MEITSQIEKVPDKVQELISKQGCEIVFFKGPITDNPEWVKHRGENPTGWFSEYTWDDLNAGYKEDVKKVFFGVDKSVIEMEDPSLHEYGHAFDYIVGKYFYGKRFSKIDDFLKVMEGEPFDFNYFNNPREYIANSFDMYYRSDETRERLRLKNPGIFKLLSEVESNILDGSEGLEGVAKREDYEKVLNRQRSSWYLFRRLRGSN